MKIYYFRYCYIPTDNIIRDGMVIQSLHYDEINKIRTQMLEEMLQKREIKVITDIEEKNI